MCILCCTYSILVCGEPTQLSLAYFWFRAVFHVWPFSVFVVAISTYSHCTKRKAKHPRYKLCHLVLVTSSEARVCKAVIEAVRTLHIQLLAQALMELSCQSWCFDPLFFASNTLLKKKKKNQWGKMNTWAYISVIKKLPKMICGVFWV